MGIKRKKIRNNIIFIIKNILFYLLLVLVLFSYFISKEFNNVGFEQLLFTLSNPEGANFEIVYKGIFFVFGFSSLIFTIIFLCGYFIRKNDISAIINFEFNNKKIFKFDLFRRNILRQVISFCIIILICVYYSITTIGFKQFVVAQKNPTSFFEKYYIDPSKVSVEFGEEKRNLIYVYAESLETTSLSIDNGGTFSESIVPNLENMALENINFSNSDLIGGIKQVTNTGWTMAGLVAQTAGIPFKVKVDGNEYKVEKPLPGAYTLGEILEKNGYKNYFMMGSDGDYGGRKNYFQKHGNYEIYDYYYAIEDGYIDKDYKVWWGFEDKKLFSYAKKKLLEISKNDEPFNFTILTADTHFTDGYMDDSCEEKFDSKYANAFYCSDSKIYNFIEWIKKQEFYKNTTIVIVGDHLTMQENFYSVSNDDSRYIYNVFINSSVDTEYSKNREFTHFDIYPTTLAAMGAKIEGEKLGLGVNLFSGKSTILEKLGYEKFDGNMIAKSNYYDKNILGYTDVLIDKKVISE